MSKPIIPPRAAWELRSSQCDCGSTRMWEHNPDCTYYHPLKRWSDGELRVELDRIECAIFTGARGLAHNTTRAGAAYEHYLHRHAVAERSQRRLDAMKALGNTIRRERALRDNPPFEIVGETGDQS